MSLVFLFQAWVRVLKESECQRSLNMEARILTNTQPVVSQGFEQNTYDKAKTSI